MEDLVPEELVPITLLGNFDSPSLPPREPSLERVAVDRRARVFRISTDLREMFDVNPLPPLVLAEVWLLSFRDDMPAERLRRTSDKNPLLLLLLLLALLVFLPDRLLRL